ncbi:sugar-binding domain-containing protein [Niabella hibiscisoli]|uniref:sugar-binding domain-containing protein n=1 Tax=Niabella hibiscisoli TaxID=1825928 RepID=UPI001F111B0E|nr:sugar-binding domain-containing protein [Niabella hibiscisoli]MCH5720806.1 hypothetical protein [Niabella hibiscisoli]
MMKYWFLFISMAFQFCAAAQQSVRLINDWQFLKQDLGGIWEAVRPGKEGSPELVPLWSKVSLPHCANEKDAVDPDVNYYQGPMWYKTQLDVKNPYDGGRTLLHFEGAGQKTQVYVYTTKVGEHVGGYDEWSVDITEAVASFRENKELVKAFKGKVPLSVRCDNSRDLEMMPSDLSDFNVYGGLYRYVNLVYQPSLYISGLFATPVVAANSKSAIVNVKVRFENPGHLATAQLSIKIKDPLGREVQKIEKQLQQLSGDIEAGDLIVKNPRLWSTDQPVLYTLEATVTSGTGTQTTQTRIGFRSFEFVKKDRFY